MRVEVSENKIEGFCHVKGFKGEVSVISFLENMGRWHTGSSMCLPSDTEAAMQVLECMVCASEHLKMKEREYE